MGSRRSREACDHPALRAPLLKEGNCAVAGSFLGKSRECVGEGMGMGGNRFGLGKSDFLDNNDLPTNSSVADNRLPRKIGRHGQEQSTCSIEQPGTPSSRRGQGVVQNGTAE